LKRIEAIVRRSLLGFFRRIAPQNDAGLGLCFLPFRKTARKDESLRGEPAPLKPKKGLNGLPPPATPAVGVGVEELMSMGAPIMSCSGNI